jgi:hypothetical protein
MAFGRGARYILMEALVAAVLAPVVFALLRRGSLPGTDPRHSLRIKMALLADINRQDGAPELRRRTRLLYLVLILVFGALYAAFFSPAGRW